MSAQRCVRPACRVIRKSAAQLFKSQALAAGHLFADKQALGRMSDTGYDLILRDAVMWPAALLEDLLGVPSVELGTSLTPNINFWQRAQNYVVGVLSSCHCGCGLGSGVPTASAPKTAFGGTCVGS
ncbi:hypothetical protein WJX82_003110 [Trebouxia sp. C0006]